MNDMNQRDLEQHVTILGWLYIRDQNFPKHTTSSHISVPTYVSVRR